jgi:hypothetical protein
MNRSKCNKQNVEEKEEEGRRKKNASMPYPFISEFTSPF